MPKVIQALETWAEDELAVVEADLEAMWQNLKPEILALGKTVLSQVAQAAEEFVSTGGNITDAVAVIVAQLPADANVLQTAVAGAIATQVSSLSGAATITPAVPPTPPAPPAEPAAA